MVMYVHLLPYHSRILCIMTSMVHCESLFQFQCCILLTLLSVCACVCVCMHVCVCVHVCTCHVFTCLCVAENPSASSSEDEVGQEMVNISLYCGGPDITHTFPATEQKDNREYHR